MSRPVEIVEAEVVEALAQRYNRMPEQIRRMDASLLKHVTLATMAPSDTDD